MPILVDFSQIYISNVMRHLQITKGDELSPDLVRHMVLNSIRSYRTKFANKYGEIVLACDSTNYWRKDLFPHYKAHRKVQREKTDHDWTTIYRIQDELKQELSTYFPYPLIEVERVEADDIIAVLSKRLCKESKVMIVSGDHDYQQLQKYPNIEQFNPIKKRHIKVKDPHRYTLEHIITGDQGDGIPSILDPDDKYVSGIRANSMTTKFLEECLSDPNLSFGNPAAVFTSGELLRNYQRNEALIDMEKIPKEVEESINLCYNEVIGKPKTRSRIMSYMIKYKMKNLVECINDF